MIKRYIGQEDAVQAYASTCWITNAEGEPMDLAYFAKTVEGLVEHARKVLERLVVLS